MSAPKWHEGRMAGWDTESTGVNVFEDRIVTAAIIHHNPGNRPRALSWVINPGTDIPQEASDVHGWTHDRLEQHLQGHEASYTTPDGQTSFMTREGALFSIAGQLGAVMGAEAPVVAANAAYDFSLLEQELIRHNIDPLSSRPTGVAGVVDPMVLEKQYDPYRKVKGGCRGGKHQCGGCGAVDKKLESLCKHYGVPLTAAHDAGADALAALRLARRLADLWPDIARLKLPTLHQKQTGWRAEQMDGLRTYFDRAGIEHDGCCGEWPVHRACVRRSGVAA